ncbi:MAG: hypothetical protein UV51_C0009G0047, partial [Candidatus Woesebacteria bacterium GW2011_GWC1_42_9]
MSDQQSGDDINRGEVKINLWPEISLRIGEESVPFGDGGALTALVMKHSSDMPVMISLGLALSDLEDSLEKYDVLSERALEVGLPKEADRFFGVAAQIRQYRAEISLLRHAVSGVVFRDITNEQKRQIDDLEESNSVLHGALDRCETDLNEALRIAKKGDLVETQKAIWGILQWLAAGLIKPDDFEEPAGDDEPEEPVIEVTRAEVDAVAPSEVGIRVENLEGDDLPIELGEKLDWAV